MKIRSGVLFVTVAMWLGSVMLAANPPQAAPANGAQLDAVLTSMDKAAAKFKSIECTFEWDQYTKIVNETDVQNGTIYFRRLGSTSVEMAAHIEKPETKIVVFSDGVIRIYQPKQDVEQVYNAGKNKEEFESFLVLGFGGRGHDLVDKFDVQYAGTDAAVANAAKLVLTPKEAKVAKVFSQIILWIDPSKGVSVQQKFIEPVSGDYRLAKYSDIKVDQKLPDGAFTIKTTKKTKILTPNG